MMVDETFHDRLALVKEGLVFLEGGESGRMFSSEGDIDRGGYSEVLFVPYKLDRCCRENKLLVFSV